MENGQEGFDVTDFSGTESAEKAFCYTLYVLGGQMPHFARKMTQMVPDISRIVFSYCVIGQD